MQIGLTAWRLDLQARLVFVCGSLVGQSMGRRFRDATAFATVFRVHGDGAHGRNNALSEPFQLWSNY